MIVTAATRLVRTLPRVRHAFARQRVGLGVSADRVSAVLLNRDRVTWSATLERDAGTLLSESLGALLAQLPARRWPRPLANAAVGPAGAQLKRLVGLPDTRDTGELAALVRDNAQQFFLVNGVPVYSAGVRLVAPATGWAAAIDAPVANEIARACRTARLDLRSIAPTAVVLERAVTGTRFAMLDGTVRTEITLVNGALETQRRMACDPASLGAAPPEMPPLVPALATVRDAHRVADAFGAACMPPYEPLAVTAQAMASNEPASHARVSRVMIALVLALAIALVIPPVIATYQGTAAQRAAARLEPQARMARDDARALTRASTLLAAAGAFEQSRRSVTQLLRDLTRALPDGAALAEFELDSTGAGSLVAYAPRAAEVVDAVERVPGLTGPAIIGPVTQETVGALALERVTVRFMLVPSSQRPASERSP